MDGLKIIFILSILYSCTNTEVKIYDNEPINYPKNELRKNDSTFMIEAHRPYENDNKIYNSCYEITYAYQYEKSNEILYSNILGFKDWNFVTKDSLEKGNGFKYITLTSENPNYKFDYTPQSTIKYEYISAKNEILMTAHTGAVENHKNILIHNPRGGIFQKLFSFPWPSIKFPLETNQSWEWEWSYNSDTFGDNRIFNWDGITKMKYQYNVIGNEILKLEFGTVKSTKIEAIGTNGVITNKLTYYFNSKIGFVKQIFETHDGATITLTAKNYKNNCETSG